MPQFDFVQPVGLLGSVATTNSVGGEIDSFTNEVLAQISTITATGTATAGTYTIQLDADEGTFTVDVVMTGGETTTVFTAALVAAFGNDPDLLNIVNAVDADPDTVLNFLHSNQVWTVTITSNPGGFLAIVLTQAAGGTDIGLGLVVVSGTGENFVIAPSGTSVAADFLGLTERSLFAQINRGIDTEVDSFEPGNTVSVLSRGDEFVFAEDAVTFNAPVFVRITATGTEQFGALRSDADGGDAITWPGATFRSTSTGPGLVIVRLNLA